MRTHIPLYKTKRNVSRGQSRSLIASAIEIQQETRNIAMAIRSSKGNFKMKSSAESRHLSNLVDPVFDAINTRKTINTSDKSPTDGRRVQQYGQNQPGSDASQGGIEHGGKIGYPVKSASRSQQQNARSDSEIANNYPCDQYAFHDLDSIHRHEGENTIGRLQNDPHLAAIDICHDEAPGSVRKDDKGTVTLRPCGTKFCAVDRLKRWVRRAQGLVLDRTKNGVIQLIHLASGCIEKQEDSAGRALICKSRYRDRLERHGGLSSEASREKHQNDHCFHVNYPCNILPYKWLYLLVPFVLSTSLFAQVQVFRVDPTPAMTTSGTAPVSGYPALYAVAGASVSITTDAAGQNPATTYASLAGSTACPINAPVVLAGTTLCVATTGPTGAFGFFLAAGTYYYQLTLPNGTQSPRFTLTINTLGVTQITAGQGVSISPSGGTGNVTINATGAIPLTSAYNWGPVASGSTLTGGNSFTLTLSPVPLGVNAANPSYYMEITGCSGGNQTVSITGGSAVSGATSGTVIFTPANSCALGFDIASASAGLQEAICALPSSGGEVIINNAPTLYSNVNNCSKTDVAVFKQPGSTVTGSYTILGSNISSLAGSIWIGNNSYITDAGIVFPALTGIMISNGASGVTATNPLPRANGGFNSTTAGTGIIRDGTTPSASELSGDATTSGNNVVTVVQIEGGAIPASATVLGTNSGKQLVSQSVQGAGDSKIQMAGTNNGVSGAPICNDSNGGTTTSGCTPSLPSGTQTQILHIQPNTGNNSTYQWTAGPFFNLPDYNFPAQTPGGSLTASSPATVSLSPCPLGVNGSDSYHYLYVSGGTGTAEAVLITGGSCTSGATSGNVTFTPSNNHTGSWTIASSSAGLQEAVNVVYAASGGTIHVPSGTYNIYATVSIGGQVTILGDGPTTSILQGQSASLGIINAYTATSVLNLMNIQVASSSQGTLGGYGVQLTAASGGSAYHHFDNVLFSGEYDELLATEAVIFHVNACSFVSPTHTGINVVGTNTGGFNGPTISNNVFYVASSFGGSAGSITAGLLLQGDGAITVTGNQFLGGNSNGIYMQYCIEVNSTALTGLLIANNDCEDTTTYGFLLNGSGGSLMWVSIVGNHILASTTTTWQGIVIAGTWNYGTIVGNVLLGYEGSSGTTVGINTGTQSVGWEISGNIFENFDDGVYMASGSTYGDVGRNLFYGTGTPIVVGGTTNTISVQAPGGYTYATLPTCAAGSTVYCTDCNSTCSAGSSNGTTCVRTGAGTWVH